MSASPPSAALLGFFELLRGAGLRVGLSESQDALRAVQALGDLGWLRAALRATLVKRSDDLATFERAFDLYFLEACARDDPPPTPDAALSHARGTGEGGAEGLGAGSGHDGGSPAAYARALARAAAFIRRHVLSPDRPDSARGAQEALWLLSRAVQERVGDDRAPATVRRDLERHLLQAAPPAERDATLRALLGRPDVERVAFDQMDDAEARLVDAQVDALVRALMRRPRRRVRAHRRGRPDLRRTLRRSLQLGGVPLHVARQRRRREEPNVFVLADVSGSVRAFARFFFILTGAFQAAVGRCRSFAFVDDCVEVTPRLRGRNGRGVAVERLLAGLGASGLPGHRTDYGRALAAFEGTAGRALNRRSTLVVLGDARTNQAPPRAEVLRRLKGRAGRVLWFNPERRARWDTGDSVMARYAPHLDSLQECRDLAQLRAAVRLIVRASRRAR